MKDAEVTLMRENKYDFAGLKRCMQDYCIKNTAFYKRFFKDNAFTGEMEMLPVQGRIAIKLQAVLEAEKTGDVNAGASGKTTGYQDKESPRKSVSRQQSIPLCFLLPAGCSPTGKTCRNPLFPPGRNR